MPRFDVAVVGAGPAGAWTACLLARRGARVALIDGSHPREKPCGGGVTGRALALVSGALTAAVPLVTIRQARFVHATSNRSTTVALEAGARALVVASRAALDADLVAAAIREGAALVSARATAIVRDRTHWRIQTAAGPDVTAGALVGADGTNSLTRRRLARAFRRSQLSIATGFYAHGVTGDDIVIEFTADPPGYIWSFPRPDHLAVGICAQADSTATAATLRAEASRWIAATGVGRGARLEPYAWPIPSLSARDFEGLEPAGPDWLLVGDAAGLVDPITREGIFFALRSAALAAESLSSRTSRSPASAYRDRVVEEMGTELARAARFKATFFRPRFVEVMLDALHRSERIRAVMADLIAGTQGYGGLKWRLARTCEWGIAVRALAAATGTSSRRELAPARRPA